jgi:two-component system OmpR family sensor kinase
MAVFIIALTLIGGPLISSPIAKSVDDATATLHRLGANAPVSESADALIDQIVKVAANGTVNVAIIPPPESEAVASDPPHGPVDLAGLLGMRGALVKVRNYVVIVIPAIANVDAAIRWYLGLLGVALVISLIVSFTLARWSAAQAMTPLLAVTRELERFAAGDFHERMLEARDRGEIGALTTAFNGAARHVARSFDERKRSDASHELRTPLTVVKGFVDVLRRGGFADDTIRDSAFARMSVEISRMSHLIDRLIVLARMERSPSLAPEVVDVGDMAREAIASRAFEGRPVALARDGGPAHICAEPSDVLEAIGNLVENATKYGKDVRVSVDCERDVAIVRVRDRGPGIAANDVGQIFERFYRSDLARNVAGSGLGLTIAQSATKRAGGTLTLEDPTAGNTTFALRLPLYVPVTQQKIA